MRFPTPLGLALSVVVLLSAGQAQAVCSWAGLKVGTEVAELETSLGTICIELLRDGAPGHVDNFLYYLQNGLLTDTFFHRSVPGFIIQGGGFTVGPSEYEAVPADPNNPTVTNEPCTLDTVDPNGIPICSERGNERGTVALAKLGGQPSSGSTNWFINLADNRPNLDNQNGGFTVFGRVISGGMVVADAIADLPLATPDEYVWIQDSMAGLENELPLVEPPVSTSTAFGCFDPVQQATVIDPNTFDDPQLGAENDPILPLPFTVAAPCGTPINFDDFDPKEGPEECPDVDRLAAETTGPVSLLFPGGTASWINLTCEQTQEALAQRALWLAAYKPHFNSKLVFIESANVQTVISPAPAMSPSGAALLTTLILASGCWMFRRRSLGRS
jgi:cyclophilin family peptidyl-prolyl cis-trans isomerase